MLKKLQEILDSYQAEMVENLQKLVRIRSVLSEGNQNAPFGEGIQQSLEFVMNLGKEKGFECINFNNHACEINLGGSGDDADSVGVVTHLDVVPEGSGWKFDPYGGELFEGRIYGRGAVDDKGPLIAAFYACCALKDSGLSLSKKIKHIIGTNEEGGAFPCIEYYKAHGKVPGCGIVPDSWFPVAYAEKGFLNFQFTRQIRGLNRNNKKPIELVHIDGGEALNVVASEAKAEFFVDHQGKETILSAIGSEITQGSIEVQENGNSLLLRAIGKSAHASAPELGINAISRLLVSLEKLDFEPVDLCYTIHHLAEMVGKDYDGSGLGIKCSDHTGELTNNAGILSYTEGLLTLKMNIRSPITLNPDDLEKQLKSMAENAGMIYLLLNYNPHFYMPVDHPNIKLLVEVYQEITGDRDSKPKAHGGGSYARILDNFIPFGPSIEGEELCFHKQNESISCERLLLLSKIYAEALYQLAK